MIHVSRLIKSFVHAFHGLMVVFAHEHSFRIQLLVGACVIALGSWFHIRRSEWIVLLLLIVSVLCLELINSVFERLVDAFKPRIHPLVRDVKDIMAATVLLMSAFALVIGLVIFVPYFSAYVLP